MTNIATSAQVRSWAIAKGLAPEVNIGRLSSEVVDEFNRRHKAQYTPGVKPARTIAVKVPAEDSRGRKITKTVRVEAQALRKGIKAGKAGRVDNGKAVKYVIRKGLV